MKELKNVTIGTDPEVFLFNTKDNEFISAIPYIKGTKTNPEQIKELGKGYAIQTDNILAEFNVPPVKIENGGEFINNILKMKEWLNNYLKQFDENICLKPSASEFINEKYLQSEEATHFGCDPDYNVYTNEMNPKPRLIDPRFRSSGFHIHIGYDKPGWGTNLNIIRYLDAFLGIQSVLEDTDTNRRTLYGKAGSFRFQPWGVEYRVLSGYFLKDENTISWVYERVCKALKAMENKATLPAPYLVTQAINKSDKQLAEKLINDYNLL